MLASKLSTYVLLPAFAIKIIIMIDVLLNKINKRNAEILSENLENWGGLPSGKLTRFYKFAAKILSLGVNSY